MTKFVSFVVIATFALSVSAAEAAKKKPPVAATSAASAPVQNSSGAKKASYGKGMQTNFGPRCKMSGNC